MWGFGNGDDNRVRGTVERDGIFRNRMPRCCNESNILIVIFLSFIFAAFFSRYFHLRPSHFTTHFWESLVQHAVRGELTTGNAKGADSKRPLFIMLPCNEIKLLSEELTGVGRGLFFE